MLEIIGLVVISFLAAAFIIYGLIFLSASLMWESVEGVILSVVAIIIGALIVNFGLLPHIHFAITP